MKVYTAERQERIILFFLIFIIAVIPLVYLPYMNRFLSIYLPIQHI